MEKYTGKDRVCSYCKQRIEPGVTMFMLKGGTKICGRCLCTSDKDEEDEE